MHQRPLSDAFGLEVTDIDLADPTADAAALRALFDDYGLVVFRDQCMDKARLVAATRIFGVPELHPLESVRDPEVPEVIIISTHGSKGDIEPESEDEIVGQMQWHTDLGYMTKPNRGAMIYGAEIPPEGGMTGFVDRQRAYSLLDRETKMRLEELHVVQSWRFSRDANEKLPNFRPRGGKPSADLDRFDDVVYPLVYRHPANGEMVLNIAPQWAAAIPELPGAEGRALLDRLIDHALRPGLIYWHQYRPGDVLLWDNWRAMHCASGTKGRYRRTMHRTTIEGSIEFGRRPDTIAA